MAETKKSFNQVKNLLGKLDRSIDEARSKRLGIPDADEDIAADAGALDTVIGRAEGSGTSEGPVREHAPSHPAPAMTTPPARKSLYGRAKPLNRPGTNPTSQWSS
jgi:hypothetical protein